MFRGRDPVGDDRVELVGRHAGVCRRQQVRDPCSPPASDALQIALEQRGERLRRLPFGMLRRQRLDAVDAKSSWKYIGCSAHSVPSLSNVAMRSGAGTKSAEPSFVTLSTNCDDRSFRRRVVPRRQRIGGERARRQEDRRQRNQWFFRHREGPSIGQGATARCRPCGGHRPGMRPAPAAAGSRRTRSPGT